MADRTFSLVDGGRVVETGYHEGVDLARRAEAAGRPVAIDLEEGAAYLGVSAPERASQLASLEAPDFTLPDLAGQPHSLSDHRGRKVFLVAYASW
jgi:AhpC/TSA family